MKPTKANATKLATAKGLTIEERTCAWTIKAEVFAPAGRRFSDHCHSYVAELPNGYPKANLWADVMELISGAQIEQCPADCHCHD